ncbi:YraN family protein [Sphingomonas sp. LaA6.9]|uniref:YraN family protein n=1 Tax=Sphingomonas sp. LaA6.9 TaxID=2919914 RepID=UPI001F502586|nr:YraN family protein [Sphingomonas sp. LaA6.9]MCJ8159397.1 YraN family protein [Sphingomonas sp. LaA6.9]
MNRRHAEQRGRAGETAAAWWLRFQGWRIVARRVKTPMGEVDLVAKRGRTVAFVEVKTRATSAELDVAIDRHRLTRVAAAANALAPRFARNGEDIRIDVLLLAPWRMPRHIANAWHG